MRKLVYVCMSMVGLTCLYRDAEAGVCMHVYGIHLFVGVLELVYVCMSMVGLTCLYRDAEAGVCMHVYGRSYMFIS